MRFIKPDININFIGNRNKAFIVSALLLLATLVSLFLHGGPKLGIDFAGGTTIQVKFSEKTDLNAIRRGLSRMNLEEAVLQRFGDVSENEYLIRTKATIETKENFSADLTRFLNEATSAEATIRRIEMVGPQVGEDLRKKALLAMFSALLIITIYISIRFESNWQAQLVKTGFLAFCVLGSVFFLAGFKVSIPILILAALVITLVLFWFLQLRYAMGAIVALVHDVTITVGLFSIFGKEFSLPIIAALLTIIGYSLNDTIIVYDRIRENLRKFHKNPLDVTINKSINETLSRTILTSVTTLIVVCSLFILGGGIIHDFSFALIVGVLVGTYSSIFVASPILLAWQGRAAKR